MHAAFSGVIFDPRFSALTTPTVDAGTPYARATDVNADAASGASKQSAIM
jgi:hypothetical protein